MDGMRNKLKKQILIIISVGIMVVSGCGYSMGEKSEMRSYEKQGKKNAIAYIEEKYGFTPEVISVKTEKSHIVNPGLLFPEFDFSPSATGNVYVQMEYEGRAFAVFISGEEKTSQGCDNYQMPEILKGIGAKLQECTSGTILDVDFAYGHRKTIWESAKENGFVQGYYDGTNLEEVFGNYKVEMVVHLVDGDIDSVSAERFQGHFGENTDIYLIEYVSEEAFRAIDNPSENIYTGYSYGDIERFAMQLKSITEVDDNIIFTTEYNLKSDEELYYMLENGRYCNFEETTIDTSGWSNGYRHQVGKTYKVDTDAEYMDLWIPFTNAPGANPNDLVIGFRFYDEYSQDFCYTECTDYKDAPLRAGYVHGGINLRDYNNELVVTLLKEN